MTPVGGVDLEWDVGVTEIKQAAEDSATIPRPVFLMSPTTTTPLGGVRWGMQLQCSWDASKKGNIVGLFVRGESLPAGSFCLGTFSLSASEAANNSRTFTDYIGRDWTWGFLDFFQLGAMVCGFDEAAWAAKGLPTSGSIKLRLTVKDVGM
jgi:hypothetical protein